jgi:N-acetylneuraminic acid mutarotase
MKRILFSITLLLMLPTVSRAHFLWLLSESAETGGRVQVYFGEAAEPDDPDLLERVTAAQVWSVGQRGEPRLLPLSKADDSLTAELAGQATRNTLILKHSYGVLTRGDSAFLLNYYAKTYPFPLPGTWREVDDAERLPLEIVPTLEGKSTVLQLKWQGQPSPDCEVVIVGPGIDGKIEGTTDEGGSFRCHLPEAGIYSIRARFVENSSGTLDGKAYGSIRHYSTLSLRNVPTRFECQPQTLPDLPQGITSFGGAISGDTVFAYGGNYGSAHHYTNEEQSNDLWSLDLASPQEWKKLTGGPRLQGLAMVAYGRHLYRVGGFTALNSEGEEQNLQSQATVARFDLQAQKWEDLPSLPEPRSSHDAAVVGNVLYVAGGWNMPGADEERVWHQTAWAMDLIADELTWKAIAAPPFTRRALALAAWQGKLFCIGGMREEGGPSTEVDVYDPATDSWSKGAAILGSVMDGFGSSAFACQEQLFVSTISGSLQRLSSDGHHWEFVGQLDHPRFFHRLLPWRNTKLVAIGGGNMEVGKVTEVDVIPVK